MHMHHNIDEVADHPLYAELVEQPNYEEHHE
jgi:hypothetical protein